MRISLLPAIPTPPPPPTSPEITFTVRGIRLVNREWSLRDACFPITITTSPNDPQLSSVEAEIMLRDGAVGLYHHESKTYIPLRQIYMHSEYLSGSEASLQSRSSSAASSREDLTAPNDDNATNMTPPNSNKVIWDVVYRRPGSSHSISSDSSSSFFEDDDDRKAGKWSDMKRCAWILWDGTYVFLSIKRPLVYLDDLQKGIYATTWRERGKKKVEGWFGKKRPTEEHRLC
ncbi:hypothetical protein ABW20_dc0110026 [Dactylellina cionopaga]|nr:hypothetical protein ABW20_dc0110026 [Dactylellina cionopaga]